jgi:hypothetical protein
MDKVHIKGFVHSISGIKPIGKNGYVNQVVVLHIPEETFRGKKVLAEYFVITIFSNSTADSRFIQPEVVSKAIGAEAHAECYLKGERWIDNGGVETFTHKLNLVQWVK